MDKTDLVYNYIVEFIGSNGYPPTVREICNHVKLDSTSSVVYHLKKLEEAGKIIRNGNKNRAIELTDKSVTIHHFSGSWIPKSQKIKYKIINKLDKSLFIFNPEENEYSYYGG